MRRIKKRKTFKPMEAGPFDLGAVPLGGMARRHRRGRLGRRVAGKVAAPRPTSHRARTPESEETAKKSVVKRSPGKP